MKILVIGGGGREHAIIWKLKENPEITQIYCAPGNGGIGEIAECVNISATDLTGLLSFARDKSIDFVIVAPETPLAMGAVDLFQEEGFNVFGPSKDAAILESSKAFSKGFMKKYKIPTADYETFDDYNEASAYIKNAKFPLVIKADGLALGKGVIICNTPEEAETSLKEIMIDKKFDSSGNKVVIEEFLTGPEVSVMAFCDGKTLVPMVSAQDHKRVFDNDLGPNTGGMGAFSPSRYYTEDIASICTETIFKPTVEGMALENRRFKGIIYFGLMLTSSGPKVIEYNARFGDPETQVVLPRLKTDLLTIMQACTSGELDKLEIEWKDNGCACIIIASGGYPESYEKGYEIRGLECGSFVFHSGTRLENGRYYTDGGRVLGVTATENTLDEAIAKAYASVSKIDFKNKHFRTDIGK